MILVHCFSKKVQRIAQEAMDVCLRVLKESNSSRFDSYSVRKSALIICYTTFRDCQVQSFSDILSQNSCILKGPAYSSQDAHDGDQITSRKFSFALYIFCKVDLYIAFTMH